MYRQNSQFGGGLSQSSPMTGSLGRAAEFTDKEKERFEQFNREIMTIA